MGDALYAEPVVECRWEADVYEVEVELPVGRFCVCGGNILKLTPRVLKAACVSTPGVSTP